VLAVAALAPVMAELDVNPLFVLPRGCVAGDGLVRPLRCLAPSTSPAPPMDGASSKQKDTRRHQAAPG
jgi:hypothetical protein